MRTKIISAFPGTGKSVYHHKHQDTTRKDEFIDRYKKRGNDAKFIQLVHDNWDSWLDEIYWISDGCKKINMVLDNLEDELRFINACDAE